MNGLRCEALDASIGEVVVTRGLDHHFLPGEFWGVLGANGAGKTTLFRMLTGAEQPDSGDIRIGPTVQLAYVDQSRDALDPEKTVFE